MTLNTVNIIERTGFDQISQLISFPDNEQGNKEAESLFRKIALEQDNWDDEEIEDALDSGVLSVDGWELYIVHSTNEQIIAT